MGLDLWSKCIAGWLVALIVVPFTAPFSTCEPFSLVNDAAQHAPLLPAATVALRETATVPSVPAMSTAGRTRLQPISRIALTLTAAATVPAASKGVNTSTASRTRARTNLMTVLRL